MTGRDKHRAMQGAWRSRPALVSGAGVGTTVGAGGQGGSVDRGDAMFLAEIVGVSGLGIDARYAFVEQHVVGRGSGGVEEKTGGRENEVDKNPARSAVGGTLAPGDLVLVRRNVGDANEYEVVAFLGAKPDSSSGSSAGNGASFSFQVDRRPRCEDGELVYETETIYLYGPVFGEVVG